MSMGTGKLDMVRNWRSPETRGESRIWEEDESASQGLGDESPLVGSRDKTTEREVWGLCPPEADDLLLVVLQ